MAVPVQVYWTGQIHVLDQLLHECINRTQQVELGVTQTDCIEQVAT